MKNESDNFQLKEYLKLWETAGVEGMETVAPRGLKGKATADVAKSSGTETLDDIRKRLGDCKRCELCRGRNKIVFGMGNPKARLFFAGEGPGADEDAQGLPFVGRAGQLLTKIIEAIGYRREDVYIANVVKCRPPGNRAPEPAEVEQCFPFLKAQINAVNPKVIVLLGASAAAAIFGTGVRISAMRGNFQPLPWNPGIVVMPTFHPAYLLRNPSAKRTVWEDMKKVKAKLEGVL